jgi:hypothetical protein
MAEEGCAEQIKKGLDDLELLKPQLDAKCSRNSSADFIRFSLKMQAATPPWGGVAAQVVY